MYPSSIPYVVSTGRLTRCGYPGCHCHASPPQLHEVPIPHNDDMSRWFEQRSVWQLFAVVWTAGMACGVIESLVHDNGHLGTGTLKHLAFYWLFMAVSVTVGVQLGKRDKARRRRDRKP